jgi:hypothetical protein
MQNTCTLGEHAVHALSRAASRQSHPAAILLRVVQKSLHHPYLSRRHLPTVVPHERSVAVSTVPEVDVV